MKRPETTGVDISTPDKAEEIISLLDEYIDHLEKEVKYVPYQCCPVCNGTGMVTSWYPSISLLETCTVCKGTKIIPMYVLKEH
jgi:DnaJ-class molecular chaperone